TDESVEQWLQKYAGVLNIKRGNDESDDQGERQTDQQDDQEDGQDDEFMDAYGQLQRTTGGNQSLQVGRQSADAIDALLAKIDTLSRADLEESLRKEGFEVGRDVG